MKKLILSSWAMFFGLTVVAQETTPSSPADRQLLKDSRKFIVYPNYTGEEKQRVADQAALMLSSYANRESKIVFYGEDVDAVRRIEDVSKIATRLDDADLHERIGDIFSSQRDLHLSYSKPAPYGCFVVGQLFSLREVYSSGRDRRAVVSTVTQIDLVPEMSEVSVGDELLFVGDVRLDAAVKRIINDGGGANNFGGFLRGLQAITFKSLRRGVVPEADEQTFTFKRSTTGEIYRLTLPWVTRGNAECLGLEDDTDDVATTSTINDSFGEVVSENVFQQEFNQFYNQRSPMSESQNELIVNPTNDETIFWGTFDQRGKTYGYLNITGMIPSTSIVDGYLTIAGLLVNELKDTEGLIIDVRNNGGGAVVYAEALIQLFTQNEVTPYGYRPILSPLNELIISNLEARGPAFKESYDNASSDATFANTTQITSQFFANNWIGQAYFKPVAVLTNAACYSACDLFTGLMQDFTDATIWGEDLLTGAGGATVVNHNGFFVGSLGLDQVPESGVEVLPGGQNISLAWLQTVRTGKNQNRLIEDRGVLADRRARPTVRDVQENGNGQLKRIANDLRYLSFDKTSSVSFEENIAGTNFEDFSDAWLGFTVPVTIGTQLTAQATVTQTDRVEVYVAGERIDSIRPKRPWGTSVINVSVPNTGSSVLVELRGIQFGDLAWRTIRQFQIEPPPATQN